ncbi:MAG TPA: ABC transporter substrate-binding protein [Thermodesulfobacteriota bacterium]|nr:ABC transporter substrate-binding protein [Thermodesulfobacteriota bacterium]HNU71109.1 ABC transporter substrate-binding protein [Thermodesulfobacteriota bacterium]
MQRILRCALVVCAVSVLFCAPGYTEEDIQKGAAAPLDPQQLKKELSFVLGKQETSGTWPRTISYTFTTYDYRQDSFRKEERVFVMTKKPMRIIPHSVGVAEILWAICPRERIVAFNEFSAQPDSSVIAEEIRSRGPIFLQGQTELVIGYQPDLIFTVFYSSADFKEKLKQAGIPFFDLGYFGTIESIKEQILLIGRIIGEEANASALVALMNTRIQEIQASIPMRKKPIRVLYYDEGGYVPGISSNFTSMCGIIGAVNVGAEQRVKSWKQIDNETLLAWNPDVIVVPEESNLKEFLKSSKVLSHLTAIKSGTVYTVPMAILKADSQFMVLSADMLAGIVYGGIR